MLTYSFGPIKLKLREGDEVALLVVGPRGRSLWTGAHSLWVWNSRKDCRSRSGGLSANHPKKKVFDSEENR